MTQKILILGAGGMLGHVLFRSLAELMPGNVDGTVRNRNSLPADWWTRYADNLHDGVDADNIDSIVRILESSQPDTIINCVGIIKQLPLADDPLTSIGINALFPHRLAHICKAAGVRLIHISTDCVFDGADGAYVEDDFSNAADLYGRTKYLGELHYDHCLTLRTSIIGHELRSKVSLVDWFLSQGSVVRGYTKAIYSGFPATEIVSILHKHLLPSKDLSGLYQVSSNSITKYELLKIVAEVYGKQIEIQPFDGVILDRSLDSSRFRVATGYKPPEWSDLVSAMHLDYINHKEDYL